MMFEINYELRMPGRIQVTANTREEARQMLTKYRLPDLAFDPVSMERHLEIWNIREIEGETDGILNNA